MVLIPLAKYEILQKQSEVGKTEACENNASLPPPSVSRKDAATQTTEAEQGVYPYVVLPQEYEGGIISPQLKKKKRLRWIKL